MEDCMEVDPEEGFGATDDAPGETVGRGIVANPGLSELHDRLHSGLSVAQSRDNRRVLGHVVRASVRSPLAGVDLAKYTAVVASLDTFIPPDAGSVEIDQDIFDDANIFEAMDENQLQRRLCTFLKGHGLILPLVKEIQIRATRGRPVGAVHQEAIERAMSTLMSMYGNDLDPDAEARPTKLRRVSLGLQVTTSSLCDLSVKVASKSEDYTEELFVGELKHRDAYTTNQCIAQALLYMQTVLDWLRVTMGLPVQSAILWFTIWSMMDNLCISLMSTRDARLAPI